MRVYVNGAFVEVDIEATVVLGKVVDARVVRLEQIIADHYDISIHELNNWKHNTEPKLMLCFLLVKHCGYSVASVARQYQIDRFYLQNCIKDELVKCLTDEERKAFTEGLFRKLKDNMPQAS